MTLPEGEEQQMKDFIDNLGYKAEEESANRAYELFLR